MALHQVFSARVSAGTYIRSIAHDLGAKLGCGAHLASLRRTLVGEFDISQARSLEQLQAAAEQSRLLEVMLHPRRILPEMPSVTATEESVTKIRHGQAVNLPDVSRARLIKVFAGQTDLIAIATRIAGTLFQPKVVFA